MPHHLSQSGKVEEDASIQQLGSDFTNARCLWNSEVKIILQRHLDSIKSDYTTPNNLQTNEQRIKLLTNTLSYVNSFNNYDNTEQIESAHNLAIQYNNINEWELACINNNRIDEYDEAISLLPTLRSKVEQGIIQRSEIESLLDELKKYQIQ